MCEKQIVIPNNAILYCSERCALLQTRHLVWLQNPHTNLTPSCRRKDASQSLYPNPNHPLVSPATSPPPDTDDSFGMEPRNILPAHLPTPRPFSAARIPPQAHEGKSDLDPTEWKPNLPHRPGSEAFQYLSQFHKSGSSSLTPTRRPAMARSAHSAAAVAITAPELSYTPTTSSSSEESVTGTPYEFVPRPLLPSAYTLPTTKSIDLVTPHVVSSTSSVSVPGKHTMETKFGLKAKETMTVAHLSYEKKWIVEGKRPAAGGLKKLLNVGQM